MQRGGLRGRAETHGQRDFRCAECCRHIRLLCMSGNGVRHHTGNCCDNYDTTTDHYDQAADNYNCSGDNYDPSADHYDTTSDNDNSATDYDHSAVVPVINANPCVGRGGLHGDGNCVIRHVQGVR